MFGFLSDRFGVFFRVLPAFIVYHQLILTFVALLIGGYKLVAQQFKLYRFADAPLLLPVPLLTVGIPNKRVFPLLLDIATPKMAC